MPCIYAILQAIVSIINTVDGDTISLMVPILTAGAYSIKLKKANGELSVDDLTPAKFLVVPNITAIANNAGSLTGGSLLTLTSTGAGFNDTEVSNNQVIIADVACDITSVTSTELKCVTGSVFGRVKAEYWRVTPGVWSMPDVINFYNPGMFWCDLMLP